MGKDASALTTESNTIYTEYKNVSGTRHQSTVFFQERVRLLREQL